MSLEGITKDSYGYVITLTWIDPDTNEAGDISGYTTGKYMDFKDPGGNIESKVADFVTDGSDGEVDYTVVTGDIDEGGGWNIRLKMQSGTSIMYSRWVPFDVQA